MAGLVPMRYAPHLRRHLQVAWLLYGCVLCSLLPLPAQAQVAIGERADRATTLSLGGWVQPRYEFMHREDAENLSSFYLRRVRVDLRGTVFRPELTFRIMPELARTAAMRDAWLNYAFSPMAQVRVGQFELPFQWHRFVGPRRQHFAERGVPGETFGFPTGRDIGVMLHGLNAATTFGFGLGIFDGAGRNVERSNSDGHAVSARVSGAVTGTLPVEESDLAMSPAPQLSLGAGVQAATKNEVRAWDLGRSPVTNTRADWVALTADASVRWLGFSLASDVYFRQVAPEDPAVENYSGWGYMVSAGFMVLPRVLEAVARYSDLRLDADDPATALREFGAGLNVYHLGHSAKTRVQYLHQGIGSPTRDAGAFIVELHVQF